MSSIKIIIVIVNLVGDVRAGLDPPTNRLCHNHIPRIIHCRGNVPFQRVSTIRHPERSAGIPRHGVPRNDRKGCHPELSFLSP